VGKAVVEIAAVQIPVDDFLDIGTEKPILSFEPFLVDLEKGFKMVLRTTVIIRRLRVPGMINGGRIGHDFSLLRKSDQHLIELSSYVSR
jgi:hypothetical protein